jgi:hypothetical protein
MINYLYDQIIAESVIAEPKKVLTPARVVEPLIEEDEELEDWDPIPCDNCGGSGEVYDDESDDYIICDECDGEGWLDDY